MRTNWANVGPYPLRPHAACGLFRHVPSWRRLSAAELAWVLLWQLTGCRNAHVLEIGAEQCGMLTAPSSSCRPQSWRSVG